jgi:NAD(P)-dependent dehydrogenase (short-subunit alcohol dehydrogenase family)
MSLARRHVLITGGTGALGRVTVDAFHAAGSRVSVPNADAGELHQFTANARIYEGADLRVAEDVDRLYDRACADSGPIWASVHLVGGFAMGPLVDTTPEQWRRMLDMNATTAFLCTRAAVRRMQGGGRVLNVAAGVGLDPRQGAGKVAYTVSKAAVVALTLASASELGGGGVLVNAVAPGTLDTPANREAMPGADTSKWITLPALAARIVRMCSPEWVGNGLVDPLDGSVP